MELVFLLISLVAIISGAYLMFDGDVASGALLVIFGACFLALALITVREKSGGFQTRHELNAMLKICERELPRDKFCTLVAVPSKRE
jgi:hypothetical protein